MSGRLEFRVRWQREGSRTNSAIRQTEKGALDKVKNLKWSDGPGDPPMDESDNYWLRTFGGLPKLVGEPTIEVREVGEWKPYEPEVER